MIVGNGDIATALKEAMRSADIGYIFFASGVSNSGELPEEEYEREKKLLLSQDKALHLVYFSSLSVFYSETRYGNHKRQMEELVRRYFTKYTIIRLGNIDWGQNPHTIINYFRAKIKAKEPVVIRDEYRYIINKAEFLHWIDMIPAWSCEMNMPGRMMKVADVVNEYGNS